MTGLKVVRTQMRDGLRSRWVLGYGLLLALVTEGLLRFGGSGDRALLSLLNVVLILLPLVSLVFGTMYLYHARSFIELLLTQPISRRTLFGGLFGGVTVPLVLAYLGGVGAPFLWHGAVRGPVGGSLAILLAIGTLLTVSCTAIAFYLATRYVDRATGLGAALLAWITLTILYDGLLLFLIGVFGDYPLEGPALVATLLNPVDLGRVLMLLRFDVAALMGYTGAVFTRFFGGGLGIGVAIAALLFWVVLPLGLAGRRFARADF